MLTFTIRPACSRSPTGRPTGRRDHETKFISHHTLVLTHAHLASLRRAEIRRRHHEMWGDKRRDHDMTGNQQRDEGTTSH
ncbi:hypothetical protein PAXINDRAFT_21607 [Paxillus involutus ATCC 200175]|uniref:Uncharacterized protein n=1 Tax=Paxillus involutus ATCC 200175 TaxID=664439 RepID=A0A0C9ST41_PAXIN|nr:hypothetical protein PAXINDRAFT_21607 [Paxillus involutus ATCC 200175]